MRRCGLMAASTADEQAVELVVMALVDEDDLTPNARRQCGLLAARLWKLADESVRGCEDVAGRFASIDGLDGDLARQRDINLGQQRAHQKWEMILRTLANRLQRGEEWKGV